jgi:phage terminase large subunit-like protein
MSVNRPGQIRGGEFDHAWLSELVAWPPSTRDEALQNVEHATRVGAAVVLWDTTPKRKHPLIRLLLQRSEEHPTRHVVMRGHSSENIDNLNRVRLEELMQKLEGTQRGDEELGGVYLEDDEGALWDHTWIESSRLVLPERIDRRALGIDPSTSERKGADETGMVEVAGVGDHAFVCEDSTGVYRWAEWGMKAVRRYIAGRLDCIVIERNKGGDACADNLRYAALEVSRQLEERKERGQHAGATRWRIEAFNARDKRPPTKHVPGIIYVKEVHTRLRKEERARAVATAYELGLVHHVKGAQLERLETTMCTWVPDDGGKSPDDIDALGYAIDDVIELKPVDVVDFNVGMTGIADLAAELESGTPRGRRRGSRVAGILEQLGRNEWGSTL